METNKVREGENFEKEQKRRFPDFCNSCRNDVDDFFFDAVYCFGEHAQPNGAEHRQPPDLYDGALHCRVYADEGFREGENTRPF